MTTTPTPAPTAGERFEGVMLVLILLVIGAAAAAASFTHIHDWTMANSPQGTGDWFGWANAVISDLVPLGVGLEVRRRRRHNLPIGAYPITVILAAAALSVAGQLAMAKPSVTGWLLAAVPALGFLALTKLVLSRPNAPATVTQPAAQPAHVDTRASVPVHATLHPAATSEAAHDELIPGARIIADAYRQATGHHITLDALAERLRVPHHVAERLLAALQAPEPYRPSPARLNHSNPVQALA
jgi:hypothetical protein